MGEYLEGYRKVRENNPFGTEVDKYRSAHSELRRLDKKRQSLIENFVHRTQSYNQLNGTNSR